MSLRAGAAKVEFTPEPGLWMCGFGPHPTMRGASDDYEQGYIPRSGPATGVLDPLHARAVVVAAGSEVVALVSLDVLEIPAALSREIRMAITQATGIPAAAILLNASHTHSAPDWAGLTHRVPVAVTRAIQGSIVEAVVTAHARLTEAQIGYGFGAFTEVAINRQNPGGPIDPELCVVKLEAPDGNLIAALVKYSCHPITLQAENSLYSADYPGVMSATLEAIFPGAVVAFLQGMSGNINPVAFPTLPKENIFHAYQLAMMTGRPSPCNPTTTRAVGRAVAAEALRVIARTPVVARAEVRFAATSLDLPLKALADRQLFCDFMVIDDARRASFLDPHSWTTEVQVIRLGPLHLVALPGEPYVEQALRLRASHPHLNVVALGYSNDSVFYLPIDSVRPEHRYENVAAVVARGGQSALENSAGNLLESLQ